MDDRTTDAVREGIDSDAVRQSARLAVEALRALGRAVTLSEGSTPQEPGTGLSSSSEVSLSTMRVFADALDDQIAYEMRRPARDSDTPPLSAAASCSVTTEELAAGLERHMAARLSPSSNAMLSPAERTRRFIEAHYAEPLTLDDIARAVGCARSYVAATFKREIGETPHRYIARVRMRRAAELIAQGDKVEAVMLSVGYRSKKNFYRQFKLETGVTPATYRGRTRHPTGPSPLARDH
jgi:AraC-like DNA-binding protein